MTDQTKAAIEFLQPLDVAAFLNTIGDYETSAEYIRVHNVMLGVADDSTE